MQPGSGGLQRPQNRAICFKPCCYEERLAMCFLSPRMVIVHMDQDGSKNVFFFPSSKKNKSASHRAWKTSFHYKWVIFRVQLLIYQRVLPIPLHYQHCQVGFTRRSLVFAQGSPAMAASSSEVLGQK